MVARRWLGVVAACACAAALAGESDSASVAFETPPEAAARDLLPATLVAGENYQVRDPVRSDGFMHHYALESRFGTFDAYGRAALEARVHEIDALTQLANTSKLAVVVGGVTQGLVSEVHTVTGIVTHPISTVIGIPTGISHLFQGYVAQGQEDYAEAKRVAASVSGPGESGPGESGPDGGAAGPHIKAVARTAADEGRKAATDYVDRYFGGSAAERRWYRKLAVDPYTDNQVLRDAIRRDARIDATASFAIRFASLPALPGIGIANRTMEAIYSEDPAAIRAHQKKALQGYGLSEAEIRRWHDTLLLSPTRQVLLFDAARTLDGVAGRGELFRHSMDLTSEAETQVYLQSVDLLVLAHRERRLESVLPGVRLPAARRGDGEVVVCGAFDALYWTSDVAQAERDIRETLTKGDAVIREFRLSGTASTRARSELESRGWRVRENAASADLTRKRS